MKKIYMIPTIQVVKIQPARIMAGSPDPLFDPSQSTSTMNSRRARFSDWDEEDE